MSTVFDSTTPPTPLSQALPRRSIISLDNNPSISSYHTLLSTKTEPWQLHRVKLAISDYIEPLFIALNYNWTYRTTMRNSKIVLTISKKERDQEDYITIRNRYMLKEEPSNPNNYIEEIWKDLVSFNTPTNMLCADGTTYKVEYKWLDYDNTMEIKSYTDNNPELLMVDTISLIDSGNALRRNIRLNDLELNIYYLRSHE